MTTLAEATRYHGKIAVLTAISGTLCLQGKDKVGEIAEGAVDGIGYFLTINFGAAAACEMLQQAADTIIARHGVVPRAKVDKSRTGEVLT